MPEPELGTCRGGDGWVDLADVFHVGKSDRQTVVDHRLH